jgi:hypothetical protein
LRIVVWSLVPFNPCGEFFGLPCLRFTHHLLVRTAITMGWIVGGNLSHSSLQVVVCVATYIQLHAFPVTPASGEELGDRRRRCVHWCAVVFGCSGTKAASLQDVTGVRSRFLLFASGATAGPSDKNLTFRRSYARSLRLRPSYCPLCILS